MSLPDALRGEVRQRAAFACEYCGVTETDVGGLLTIDHFRPFARGGQMRLRICSIAARGAISTRPTTGRQVALTGSCGIRGSPPPPRISLKCQMGPSVRSRSKECSRGA